MRWPCMAANSLAAHGLSPQRTARDLRPAGVRGLVPRGDAGRACTIPAWERSSSCTCLPSRRPRTPRCALPCASAPSAGRRRIAPVVAVMAHQPTAGEAGDIPVFVDVESAVQAIADARSVARWRDADALRAARETTEDEWPEPRRHPVPSAPWTTRRCGSSLSSVAIRPLARPRVLGESGCAIRLVDDPLFGMVVDVGVDDPVAEALDDRALSARPRVHGRGARHAGVPRRGRLSSPAGQPTPSGSWPCWLGSSVTSATSTCARPG